MLFADKKRISELETGQKQLVHDMRQLQDDWQSLRLQIVDLKEQAIRSVNRLDQRARRAEQKEPDGEPAKKPMNPMAERLLRGTHVLPG